MNRPTRHPRRTPSRLAVLICALGLAAGCSGNRPATAGKGEDQVREAFTALQTALKDRDADTVWALMDEESQSDAERAAKAEKGTYEKAGPEDKAKQEQALGLTAADMAALSGRSFLKTKRFHGKYDEVPDSKIEGVTVRGDRATVEYVENDGDHERLTLVRQGGRWKFNLSMPKGTQP
jgi:hypothetical protein